MYNPLAESLFRYLNLLFSTFLEARRCHALHVVSKSNQGKGNSNFCGKPFTVFFGL